jgi:hypothetical protein
MRLGDAAGLRVILDRRGHKVFSRPTSLNTDLSASGSRGLGDRVGRSVLEEREYGDDTAVDGRSRYAQLGEDRVDVLLYCRLRKEQGLLDTCVGLALGHLPENVQLTRSQGGKRAGRAGLLPRDQSVDDQRIDDRPAGHHLVERAYQVLKITNAILEQVRQTCGAITEQGPGVALIGVLREDHDADLGVFGTDSASGLNALHVVTGWHANIGQNSARAQSPDRIEQLPGITDASQDLDLPGVLQRMRSR